MEPRWGGQVGPKDRPIDDVVVHDCGEVVGPAPDDDAKGAVKPAAVAAAADGRGRPNKKEAKKAAKTVRNSGFAAASEQRALCRARA